MEEIYVENIAEVLRNKRRIEREMQIQIKNKGKIIFVNGKAENEFIAIKILEAVNLGFSLHEALKLKEDNILLHIINIKDITKRHDLERVRGRIIGTRGKTLQTLKNLTDCSFSLSFNQVGIIGDVEEIKDAIDALTLIIQGSKQGNVYGRLEKQRKKKRLKNRNLGIKLKEETEKEIEEDES